MNQLKAKENLHVVLVIEGFCLVDAFSAVGDGDGASNNCVGDLDNCENV